MKIRCLVLLVLIFSCKQKTKNNTTQTNGELIVEVDQSVNNENILKLYLDVIVPEDNHFDIFYTSDSINEPFNTKKKIVTKVNGNENYQTVVWSFPKGVKPYSFRIDLGDNALRKETNIEISAIKLKLNDKSIIINRQILDHFFTANDYLKKTDLGYLRKVDNDRYDPYLLASPVLLAKMNIEF